MTQLHSTATAQPSAGRSDVEPAGVWSDAPASKFVEAPSWLVLDDHVQHRISRLRDPRDRWSAITARALTVLAAADVLDLAPGDVRLRQECPQCRQHDHGPPSVQGHDGLHVSWAHTRSRVVAAASPLAVAVDTEERIENAEALRNLALTLEEQKWLDREHDPDAFTRLWCRKECAVKMGWVDLDRLTEVSFCADEALLDFVRGVRVVDRRVGNRRVVAITQAELQWAPFEQLRTRMDSGSSTYDKAGQDV